jgi:hypothetical protein
VQSRFDNQAAIIALKRKRKRVGDEGRVKSAEKSPAEMRGFLLVPAAGTGRRAAELGRAGSAQ